MVQARLLSMTAILTALIWASADRLVNETASVDVSISSVPSAADSDMLVRLGSAPEWFEIQISGSRKIIEAVRARGALNVRFPTPELPTGPATVSLDRTTLRQELGKRYSEFDKLRVVGVTPNSMPVIVDHMVVKDVEVTADRLALAYDAQPQLQRVSTKVRMRESHFMALPPGEPLRVEIGPNVERLLADKPFGRSATVTVPLDTRPFGPDAELVPNVIEATATVRADRSTEQIPTVPVLVAVSFANLDRSVRAVDRAGAPLELVTQTITVSGSTDEVARLARGETRAYGIIQLKEDDLQDLGVLKLVTPEYHLPPGVSLAVEPQPVELQLILASGNGSSH